MAPDPIVETRTVRVPVCPAEVTAALPPVVATPDGLVLDLARVALDWVAAHLRREALLGQRIADARKSCP